MGFMAGKKALIVGVASDRSIASGIAEAFAREGAEIFAGDTQVGTVTSGGFSPTLGHPIAMGYVDAAHAEIDTALEVQVRNKRLPARVAKMPFVQHRYFRGS